MNCSVSKDKHKKKTLSKKIVTTYKRNNKNLHHLEWDKNKKAVVDFIRFQLIPKNKFKVILNI